MENEAMGIVEIAWEEMSKERALRNPKMKPRSRCQKKRPRSDQKAGRKTVAVGSH